MINRLKYAVIKRALMFIPSSLLEQLPWHPFFGFWKVKDADTKLPFERSERIALMGISFGGSLAPRAVAFEKKVKVCIAIYFSCKIPK